MLNVKIFFPVVVLKLKPDREAAPPEEASVMVEAERDEASISVENSMATEVLVGIF